MRIEDAGARTWLLAAVALWAVCTWVLAAFGLGGHVRPLDQDPALLQPLPVAAEATSERLGPLPQYAQIMDRPLFAHDRKHRPFFIEPQGEGDARQDDFDMVLTSILITPALEMAIVQPRQGGNAIAFKVGESAREAPGWTLASVEPQSAVFVGPQGERTLPLRVFDGIGGAPPTRLAAGRDAAQPRQPPTPTPMAAAPGPAPDARNMSPETDAVARDAGDQPVEATPESQAESIRRRIEARRARLREDLSQ